MSTRIPGEPAEGTPYADGLDRTALDTPNSTEGDSNFTTDGFDSRTVVGWESNYTVCERSGFRLQEGDGFQNWDGLYTREYSRDHKHPSEFARSRVEETGHGSPNPETPIDSLTYIDTITPGRRLFESGTLRFLENDTKRFTE